MTQGDANNTTDEPIETSAIKGSVALTVPKVGYLADAIKTPLGMAVVLGLAIALVEASFRQERRARHVRELLLKRRLEDEIRMLQKELNS